MCYQADNEQRTDYGQTDIIMPLYAYHWRRRYKNRQQNKENTAADSNSFILSCSSFVRHLFLLDFFPSTVVRLVYAEADIHVRLSSLIVVNAIVSNDAFIFNCFAAPVND